MPIFISNQTSKTRAETVLNSNKTMFEPYGDLVDEAYSGYNDYMFDNQDPLCKTENNDTAETDSSNNQSY